MKNKILHVLPPAIYFDREAAYRGISRQIYPIDSVLERKLYKSFIEREELGCLQIAEGIVFPHVEASWLRESAIYIQVLDTPIQFWTPSIPQVDLILALLLKVNESPENLALIRDFIGQLTDLTYLDRLRKGEV